MADNHTKDGAVEPICGNMEEPNCAFDESYDRHRKYAEFAKSEYQRLYRQMIGKLSTAALMEPYAKVLMECEKCELEGLEEFTKQLHEKLLKYMLRSLEHFWQEHNVDNAIITLKMLEEKFKDFKGNSWNIPNLTPQQHALPWRMRFKEKQRHYLQKQLEFQKTKLEEAATANSQFRAMVHQIENNRVQLLEAMRRNKRDFDEVKSKITQASLQVLYSCTEESLTKKVNLI